LINDRHYELFKGFEIPTAEDWKALQKDVEQYGLYHAYRLAIAPTLCNAFQSSAVGISKPLNNSRTFSNCGSNSCEV
jgi:ribonucleotide reductase alpha subunit